MEKDGKNYVETMQRVPDMPEISRFKDGEVINLDEVICALPKSVREKIVASFDMKSLIKVFEDKDMMATVDVFLKSGLNVSETARKMYMHRNTLIYRLNNLRKHTGLDLRDFYMSLTFTALYRLYILK